MDKLSALIKDIKEGLLDEESIIDQYSRYEGRTPLDVLVEKESREEIVRIMDFIKVYLSYDDLKILEMYIIDGKTLEDIAIARKMPLSTVHSRLHRIPTIIANHIRKMPDFDIYNVECLIKESTLEAGKAESLGYPHEFLQRVNIGGRWRKSKGRKIWVSKERCLVPEYLNQCFQDDRTECTLCDKCKRKKLP